MNKIDGLKFWKEQFPKDYKSACKQGVLIDICVCMDWDLPSGEITNEIFIQRAKQIHGDKYSYLFTWYFKGCISIVVIKNNNNVFGEIINVKPNEFLTNKI